VTAEEIAAIEVFAMLGAEVQGEKSARSQRCGILRRP
jgi:hypothetical protein